MGKDVGIGSTAQLASLDLPQASERLGRVAKGLKAALAVYGLDLDQILDSVSIAKAESVVGTTNQRVVVLAFTALGKPRMLPLKLINVEGRWQLAGDSPIAQWLRPKTNLNMGFGFHIKNFLYLYFALKTTFNIRIFANDISFDTSCRTNYNFSFGLKIANQMTIQTKIRW